MSRHESVSCDSCLKNNFRGKRYKCVICYDYDLCATCYEAGATSSRHTSDHPMQCILTRADFDIYYGGEAISAESPQSFTCPYCGKMGYTEISLQEHVTTEHADSTAEVVCPICAALPGGDPNHVTDEFAAHLTLEHRAPRDFDEPISGIRHVRRIPHPSRGGGAAGAAAGGGGSAGGSSRARGRTNMQFHSNATAAALSGLPVGSRESMDPIAELLSQLSSVRSRAAAQSVSSQLQQLEMQLQSTRQQLERLPRRAGSGLQDSGKGQPVSAGGSTVAAAQAAAQAAAMLDLVNTAATTGRGGSGHRGVSGAGSGSSSAADTQYLLARINEAESGDWDRQAEAAANRSMFVQELLLSSLRGGLRLSDDDDDDDDVGLSYTFTEQAAALVPPSVVAAAATSPSPSLPPVLVVDNCSHNSNNSSPTTTSSGVGSTASNNTSSSSRQQRNQKVREPPPPPSSAPLSSSPSSKLVKQ